MVNSNPETVSTDYDTSNYLFFEPLTAEYVLEIGHFLKPKGVVVQLGGQTPINIAKELNEGGLALMGSSLNAIDLAEDRARFKNVCEELSINVPKAGLASDIARALTIAKDIGYPLICRPSYVLGGRRMEVIESDADLQTYFEKHAVVIAPDSMLYGSISRRCAGVGCRCRAWHGLDDHRRCHRTYRSGWDSLRGQYGVIPPQRVKKRRWKTSKPCACA